MLSLINESHGSLEKPSSSRSPNRRRPPDVNNSDNDHGSSKRYGENDSSQLPAPVSRPRQYDPDQIPPSSSYLRRKSMDTGLGSSTRSTGSSRRNFYDDGDDAPNNHSDYKPYRLPADISDDMSLADQSLADCSVATGMTGMTSATSMMSGLTTECGGDLDEYRSKFKILLKRSREKAKESVKKVEKLKKQLAASNAKLETALDELTEVKYNSAQFVQKVAQLSIDLADSKAKIEDLNEKLEYEKQANKSKATSFGAQAVKLSLELAKSKAETEKLADQLHVERHNNRTNKSKVDKGIGQYDDKKKKGWFGLNKKSKKTRHALSQNDEMERFNEDENNSISQLSTEFPVFSSSEEGDCRKHIADANGMSNDSISLSRHDKLHRELSVLEKENASYMARTEVLEAKVEELTQENSSKDIEIQTLKWKLKEYTDDHDGEDNDGETVSAAHQYLSNCSKRSQSNNRGRTNSHFVSELSDSDRSGSSFRSGSSNRRNRRYIKESMSNDDDGFFVLGNSSDPNLFDDGDDASFMGNTSSSRRRRKEVKDVLGGSGHSHRSATQYVVGMLGGMNSSGPTARQTRMNRREEDLNVSSSKHGSSTPSPSATRSAGQKVADLLNGSARSARKTMDQYQEFDDDDKDGDLDDEISLMI